MRKTLLLATALTFASVNLTVARPALVGAPGQSLTERSASLVTPVATDKKKAKTARKSSKSGGNMNMQTMPPGHRM